MRIHSVLTESWDLRAEVDNKKPLNYWFGISSGMVDIRTKELPYTTLNLLNYMKQGIVNGVFSPFSGEIRTRDGRVIQSAGPKHNTELENMPPTTIITMDWLNENVDGDM